MSTDEVASNIVYAEAIRKGTSRLQLMTEDREGSDFTEFPKSFNDWSWNYKASAPAQKDIDNQGLKDAFQSLNISTDNAEWVRSLVTHGDESLSKAAKEQSYTHAVSGTTYPATFGKALSLLNTRDGVLVIVSAYSPAHRAKIVYGFEGITLSEEQLPELRKMSDVLWGEWKMEHTAEVQLKKHTDDIRNLKYIVLHVITNIESRPVLLRALRSYHNSITAGVEFWDRRSTISVDSDEGKAILGMPIVACAAYFLSDHQKELGKKKITKFDVFGATGTFAPTVICHIGDV